MNIIQEKDFIKYCKISNKKIYLLLGNLYNNQYIINKEFNNILKKIAKNIEKNSIIFYFAEKIDDEYPDIGYIINQVYNLKNKEIEIVMILRSDLINEDYPNFVSKAILYDNYIKNSNKNYDIKKKNNIIMPLGATKIWININKKYPIDTIYILGGDENILHEFELIKSCNIPYIYIPMKRKFLGDGKTLIKKNASIENKIGCTITILDEFSDDESSDENSDEENNYKDIINDRNIISNNLDFPNIESESLTENKKKNNKNKKKTQILQDHETITKNHIIENANNNSDKVIKKNKRKN